MSGSGCGLGEWEEFRYLPSGLGGTLSQDESVSHSQELWMMQEPAPHTPLLSLGQRLLQ